MSHIGDEWGVGLRYEGVTRCGKADRTTGIAAEKQRGRAATLFLQRLEESLPSGEDVLLATLARLGGLA